MTEDIEYVEFCSKACYDISLEGYSEMAAVELKTFVNIDSSVH